MNTRIALATVVGCVASLPLPLLGMGPDYVGSAATVQGRKPPNGSTEIATLSKLPSLGSNAEAHAVNEAGTIIVGQSFDRAGYLYAVKWTLQNGSWVISTLPYPGPAATARGIDNQENVVGYAANFPRRRVLWPAGGGYRVLGCDTADAVAHGISADGQVVVGQAAARATAAQAPLYCAETLPSLVDGGSAAARAVNGNGSIIGGSAARTFQGAGLPVRWIRIPGQWQIEELDVRSGTAAGANANGDLAGHVTIPCAVGGDCLRAVIWYAAGDSLDIGTLGGAVSWARDINAAGEVVGLSTTAQGVNTAFFWSQSVGMYRLPVNRWAAAYAVSDVRLDGTRLVVGTDAQANAVVWVVRTP